MKNFENNKDKIRAFPGCGFLQLLRDKNDGSIFFTLSHWKSEEALEVYRNSELFQKVWAMTKLLFRNKPEAWSTEVAENSETSIE